ncbi:hypothetical protein TVAGG3_0054420 [Trichomonas vaginalis G3]|uniref:hypothetical protein n=1 Tax=Trichomonas vaginalis (strain ATCC PRA-98 / G3) TaxID=412133 RepID=UPI0021E53C7B|nr:hypothetical protein TVAGG3_0054420 [Trichomonas vaginalis G3]KAI5541535.1 hypothetical protein TVAGG3_0054420 [Trichomonas vaginalis G3]
MEQNFARNQTKDCDRVTGKTATSNDKLLGCCLPDASVGQSLKGAELCTQSDKRLRQSNWEDSNLKRSFVFESLVKKS